MPLVQTDLLDTTFLKDLVTGCRIWMTLSAKCCWCGTCATERLSNVVAHYEREGGFVALRSV